jgi:hypothetical protein
MARGVGILLILNCLMAVCFGAQRGNSSGAKGAPKFGNEKMQFEDGVQVQKILVGALERGEASFSIPPGNYRFKSSQALSLESIDNLSIEAKGVTFWLVPGQAAIRLENCSNIHVHGLSIDYTPLPYAQGTVIRFNRDAHNIEIEPTAGFSQMSQKWLVHPRQVKAIFCSRDGRVRNVRLDWIKSYQRLNNGDYNLSFTYNRAFSPDSDVKVGDILAMPYRGQSHCISLVHCSNIEFDGVTVFSAGQYGFSEEGGRGANQYLNCRVIRRPNTLRSISSNADAFHSTGVETGPSLWNCEFGNAGDDLVNIHGYYGILLDKIGPGMIRILEISAEAPESGMHMEFTNSDTFQTLDKAKIEKVNHISTNVNPANFLDLKKILSQICIKPLDKVAIVEITVDKKVEAPVGTLVSIPEECGAGATITHCYFHSTATRGLLIRSDRVTVSGNRIADTGMEGIRIGAERYWLEAELPSNVVVRGNTLENCGNGPEHVKAAIDVIPPYGTSSGKSIAAGRKVSITNNRINGLTTSAIAACDVDGIDIEGNIIESGCPVGSSQDSGIEVSRSKRVVIGNNDKK